jgi:hypothetical protein
MKQNGAQEIQNKRRRPLKRPPRLAMCLVPLALCLPLHAQSLDARLDEDQFLRGLVDYGLPEVLEHYLSLNPPSDPVDKLRYEIALKHMGVRDERLTDAQRLGAIEELLAARTQLLDDHKNDPRHAVWLADQAADLYFVLLPVDAAGLTSLFGLPSPEQLERAQRVARDMYQLTSLAEIEIEQAILDLEAAPGFANDISLQLQRRRLSSEQRERRIPFLLGIGALLHARLNLADVGEQRDLYALAADSLTRVTELLDGPLANQALIHAAIAEALLSNPEKAEELFARAESDVDVSPVDHFMVRLGRVMARTVHAGPHESIALLHELKRGYPGRDTLFFRILIADHEHVLLRVMAEARNGSDRARLLAGALQPYIELLDEELGVPRDTLRQIVLTRLARAIDPEVPMETMPALAAIAQAEMFAHDAATRARAIELFQQLIARADIAPADRAVALDGLGRALLADGQRQRAAEHMLDLATTHAGQPQAERAIELASSIAAELYRDSPNDKTSAALLQSCLDVLLERYQNLPTIDQWRFLAGRVAWLEERYADARAVFAQFTPQSDSFADAQFMRLQTTRAEAAAAGDPNRRQTLARQLLGEADEVEPVLRSQPTRPQGLSAAQSTDHLLATLAVYRAEAHLELNEPERAIEALRELESAAGIEPSLIAEATRLRIRAYYETNQADMVVREIERLTQSAPEEGGPMLSMLLESTQRSVESLFNSQRQAEGVAAARRELVPLADALAKWLERNTVEHEAQQRYLFRIAEAYRVADRHADALPIYDRLIQSEPEGLEAMIGKAECLYALGKPVNNTDQLGEAMLIYRRAGASSPEDLGDAWWLAQLRMLQILEATNRNTQQIVPRILQLRQRDDNLGGDRFRREFEALQNRQR